MDLSRLRTARLDDDGMRFAAMYEYVLLSMYEYRYCKIHMAPVSTVTHDNDKEFG